jgi:predicted GIY-YIG superfamily endonuclease
MADGDIPGTTEAVETALYRHFDSEGKLLYVGVSLSAVARLAQHRDNSHWYRRIANMTTEWHPNRDAALKAERHAVRTENPECNIMLKETAAEKAFRLKLEAAEQSRGKLLTRTVVFKPIYTLPQVAEALGYVTSHTPKRLIAEGKLGACTEGSKTFVTGWQLIDYLESAVGESLPR